MNINIIKSILPLLQGFKASVKPTKEHAMYVIMWRYPQLYRIKDAYIKHVRSKAYSS